jgi:predicted ATPase
MQALALAGDRSGALAQFDLCRQLLADELGVTPGPVTIGLYEQIKAGDLWGAAAPTAPGHNLPAALTPLVGREAEVAQLAKDLKDPAQRLVTIAGEGGVGKTRLALAVAEQVRGQFTHGAWFVPLDGVLAGDDVGAVTGRLVTAIAGALGFSLSPEDRPHKQLLRYLRQRQLLLVLDNFEHLMAGVNFLVELLEHCPGLKVLVTASVQLNLRSEHLFTLLGLPIPAEVCLSEADGYGSIRLFMDVAQRLRTPVLLDRDLPAITRICQLVDGLPLGIEIAAGWTGHFTCSEIAHAIQQQSDFLSALSVDVPERQRSLRAAFDYSWRLLAAGEQRLLSRLSVFHGSFSRPAAIHIAGAALPDLVGLTRRFMLQLSPPGRYQIHEHVRQFARVKLAESVQAASGAEADLRDRHAGYYADLIASQEAALRGKHGGRFLRELLGDLNNIRHAWEWAVTRGNLELLGRAAPGLSLFYFVSGLSAEAETVLRRAIERLDGVVRTAPEPPHMAVAVLGQLLAELALHLRTLARYRAALAAARRAMKTARSAGDISGEVRALVEEISVLAATGQFQEVQSAAETALAAARANGLARLEADCLLLMAQPLLYGGRDGLAAAGRYLEQSLSRHEAIDDNVGAARSLQFLSGHYEWTGHLSRSLKYRQRVLQAALELENQQQISAALNNLGGAHAFLGDYLPAKRYFQQALEIAREIDHPRNRAYALSSLSMACGYLGEHDAALVHNQQALDEAKAIGDAYLQVGAGLQRGHLLLDQQRLAEATQAARQAYSLAHALHLRTFALKGRVLRGRILLAQGNLAQAAADVEPVAQYLAGETLVDIFDVFKSHYLCYEILAAAGDPRAGDLLCQARDRLLTWAGRLDEEPQRRLFLENVAAHRQILAQWQHVNSGCVGQADFPR